MIRATASLGIRMARTTDARLLWKIAYNFAYNGIVCGDLMDAHLFDNLMPAPGQVDFFLARETGQPDYGSSTSGLAREADSGDCP